MRQAGARTILLAVLIFAGAVFGTRAEARDLYGETVVDGVTRTYTVFVPESARDRGGSVPVVIVLHGGLQDGQRIREILGLDPVAEREGFVAVYPDALRGGWQNLRKARFGSAEDVDFLLRLKTSLVRRGLADPDRVFVAGVSNGGMMVQRLACEVPGAFAGFASIIANMPELLIERCAPDRPAPMMMINGTDDSIVPYEGGFLGLGARRRGQVVSSIETVEFWRAHNGCNRRPGRRMLPDRDPDDGSRVAMFYSTQCRGAPVIYLRVEGGGHRVPGSPFNRFPRLADRTFGVQNNDISTAEVISRFFAGLDRTS